MTAPALGSIGGIDRSDAQFRQVGELVARVAGIQLPAGKESLVRSRLAKRLRALGIATVKDYLDLLDRDTSRTEIAEMVDVLTTNKTSFFREAEHFRLLEASILPALGRGGAPIRIWSAGCSTGEVDDSAVVRKALSDELSRYPDIEVVGTAMDPYVARDKIIELRPDVLTLDVEMPRMDGLSFLERLMQHYPLPVIIVSSLTPKHSEAAVRALALGAVDVVPKPGTQYSVSDVERHLVAAVRAASRARLQKREAAPRAGAPAVHIGQLRTTDRIVAIGASTGGTGAIEEVLRRLPANAPAVVIAQHMPAGFTASFAQRLNQQCAVIVREARDGDILSPGLALVAPGNYHLVVQRSGAQWLARVKDGPLVHHQRPAVDVLFQSVSKAAGRNAVGVILTGMGEDGARGLLTMREGGAWTIAQDERTSVVFGMPRAAFELGAACEVRALHDVTDAIIAALSANRRTPLANAAVTA